MKQKLYSLYDKVAEQFGPVFQGANNNTAIRAVQNMNIRSHADFELYLIGEWDMESGRLQAKQASEFVKLEWATPAYAEQIKAKQLELGV